MPTRSSEHGLLCISRRKGDFPQPELPEARKEADEPGRTCGHGRREVNPAAEGRAAVLIGEI